MGRNDDFDVPGESPALTKPLLDKIQEAAALTDSVDQMEEDLRAAKATLHQLTTRVIPDMLTELAPGLTEMKVDGWQIKVQTFFSGSLPKDQEAKERAIRWLEDHGQGSLIKTQIVMSVPKDHRDAVPNLVANAREMVGNLPIDVSSSSNVHSQTLLAFVREAVHSGAEVDLELLGIYSGKVAKFSRTRR